MFFLRLALLLMLATAVGATFLVEQPSSSLLMSHDRLDELIRKWRKVVPVSCNGYYMKEFWFWYPGKQFIKMLWL